MEQHSIPQQISSYEFKLVGDMTLKQFLKAGVGIILAILINSTKLMILVKWPLMFLFGAGGLLLAFVPFQDRPLESWIISFIKAIYSPTIYTYQRKGNKNWLDLDLTKTTKQNEEDIVIGKSRSSFLGNKIKDSITTMEIKVDKKENKKQEINIEEIKTEVNVGPREIKVEEIKKENKEEIKTEDWRDQKTDLNLKTEKLGATGKAIFGMIPMPDIPEIPNVIVGMATNMDGKIVDAVIVEIQDESGNPSRVLKTNSLGQFKTTTPLADGRYLIIAEKDGYNFDRVNIDLKGQIVKPVKIIANS
jgi:hypothetical protein